MQAAYAAHVIGGTPTISEVGTISAIEERFSRTLDYLRKVSEILADNGSFAVALEDISKASIPEIFTGVLITIDPKNDTFTIEGAAGIRQADPLAIIPITMRHVTHGYLRIWQERPLDAFDWMIIHDLAIRLGTALETTRIIAQQRHVADTLQQALLPEKLPETPRFTVSAAYLPATDEATVGGDWYDVFTLPDGRTAFSIGDVAGHGLDAAVIMGEVRQAFRAAAVNPKSPSLVLERANTIVNMRADAVIVTALFGIIDPLRSTVTYAVAGHPGPILAPLQGEPQLLPSLGIPLGVMASLSTRDWTMTLAPGSLFVLYTDGLIEHSRDLLLGEAELLAAVGAEARKTSLNAAQSIVDTIFTTRQNLDDAATLVFRAVDEIAEEFYFECSALPLSVPLLRNALSTYIQKRGISVETRFKILTAVGEATANAAEHAYPDKPGLLRVQARCGQDAIILEIADQGRWKPSEQHDERGRGIMLMRALSDRVEIKTTQSETLIRITISTIT